jgi:fructose-1,6-bisphosphatase/inositol monophosphatase family enzyme
MNTEHFGPLNAHNIGSLMRDAVLRACAVIRAQRFSFTSEEKTVEYKSDIDYVTSADRKAQEIYLEFLKNNFPGFGIIAEEDDLFTDAAPYREPNTEIDHFYFFTIDPLDGTKAFKRKQSDGFSSMLGLIHYCPKLEICEVIGACIGDPMTNELFYTRPGSLRVHQLDQYSREREILSFDITTDPKSIYVHIRDNPDNFSTIGRKMCNGSSPESFFKDYELQGGSIGISFAKLWKGQYGGLLLKPGKTTVWDTAPIVGICKKLGFVPMELNKTTGLYEKGVFKVISTRDYIPQKETLIIHESLVEKLMTWQQ